MPYRRPALSILRTPARPSCLLALVTAAAVVVPLAGLTGSSAPEVTPTDNDASAMAATLAEILLSSVPDITIPVRDLTGLDLPDLHLSDLKRLPLPSSLPVPEGLPLPPGIKLPPQISLPQLGDVAAPGTPAAPVLKDPKLAAQYGTGVKELRRETPFSMVALAGPTLAGMAVKVRPLLPGGTWGPWHDAEALGTARADGRTDARTGTEPLYVGKTNAVQVLITRAQAAITGSAAPPPAAPGAPAPAPALSAPPHRVKSAAFSTPLHTQAQPAPADGLTAVLIDPGQAPRDATLADTAKPLAGGPKVISRAEWGADESLRCDKPTYDDGIGGATLHHTAGRNDYSREESAGIVRAIYAYHAKTLGWCDIGYNALIDKYGQIFEGRFGGLDKPVQGAHAGGFNENTVGVALLGSYDTEQPTAESINATGQFIGWRLKLAKLDPKGQTTMWSEGTPFTRYAKGAAVKLPIIFAHRDVGETTCPGNAAYSQLGRIRDIAAGLASGPAVQAVAPGTGVLPALAAELLKIVNNEAIASRWAADGGPTGKLGAAQGGVQQASQGRQYAKFTNGYIFTAADGKTVEVLGKILEKFIETGLDTGQLGLPLSNEYPVPGGLRADFEKGSAIFNEITGFVTILLKTYRDAYGKEYNKPAPAR